MCRLALAVSFDSGYSLAASFAFDFSAQSTDFKIITVLSSGYIVISFAHNQGKYALSCAITLFEETTCKRKKKRGLDATPVTRVPQNYQQFCQCHPCSYPQAHATICWDTIGHTNSTVGHISSSPVDLLKCCHLKVSCAIVVDKYKDKDIGNIVIGTCC